MHTMRQMRTAEEFYPMLDVNEIYKLVTMKEYGLEHINPELLRLAAPQQEVINNKIQVMNTVIKIKSKQGLPSSTVVYIII